ncbi:FGGY family carbohydrate kinase [uncultured Alsobacter sp.]|uniref:FGGY family carbohydrate kinase n=1 Tax=uncultured Alsobacter sp. TaxID=1748258 RepID=UPI0025DA7601|nr:FGGY family carbohydrate kinase [uncultured Alsobacter sp.]
MTAYAAAIDQGTTSTRLLLLDEDGGVRMVSAGRHRQIHPRPGWVEHDPRELLAALRHCLDAARGVPRLGIANQGESCLAWDAVTGEPLSPVIVWQDNRTGDAIARLRAAGAQAETLARAGLPLDAYFSASKLSWLLENVPAVAEARRAGRLRLGTTDAFFLDRLTGTFATDVTTASRTSLMNLETGAWDPLLCDLFGVPAECLPEIRDTVGDFGAVGPTRIQASVVDQQAALYGHGCRVPGATKITFGTGAFALAVTGAEIVRAPEKGMLPTVAWRKAGTTTYAVDGGVYDVGSAVDWVRGLGLFREFAELDSFDAEPAIGRDLAFVPALSGLACPHWDRTAAGTWIGLGAGTTPRDLCQSLLEGIALLTAGVVEAIGSRVSVQGPVSIDGGVAQSGYFATFLAEAMEREVVRPAFHELTALGCAMLACGDAPAPGVAAGPAVRFSPGRGRGLAWRERFADAVQRSKGWRR